MMSMSLICSRENTSDSEEVASSEVGEDRAWIWTTPNDEVIKGRVMTRTSCKKTRPTKREVPSEINENVLPITTKHVKLTTDSLDSSSSNFLQIAGTASRTDARSRAERR